MTDIFSLLHFWAVSLFYPDAMENYCSSGMDIECSQRTYQAWVYSMIWLCYIWGRVHSAWRWVPFEPTDSVIYGWRTRRSTVCIWVWECHFYWFRGRDCRGCAADTCRFLCHNYDRRTKYEYLCGVLLEIRFKYGFRYLVTFIINLLLKFISIA